jgi:hypothetical protein
MIQDTKSLKAQIISTLDFLPADTLQLLAEFAVFLQSKVEQPVATVQQKPIHIFTPRLAHPEQIADFKLEVIIEV